MLLPSFTWIRPSVSPRAVCCGGMMAQDHVVKLFFTAMLKVLLPDSPSQQPSCRPSRVTATSGTNLYLRQDLYNMIGFINLSTQSFSSSVLNYYGDAVQQRSKRHFRHITLQHFQDHGPTSVTRYPWQIRPTMAHSSTGISMAQS